MPDLRSRFRSRSRGEASNLRLARSGFIDWQYGDAAVDSSGVGVAIAVVLWLGNWTTNLFVFRRGWTVYVHQGDRHRSVAKHRFPSRDAATAAWTELAHRHGVLGQEEPPTR